MKPGKTIQRNIRYQPKINLVMLRLKIQNGGYFKYVMQNFTITVSLMKIILFLRIRPLLSYLLLGFLNT